MGGRALAIRIEEITDPAHPALGGLAHLLRTTFADPNLVLSEAQVRAGAGRREADRTVHVLVALDGDAVVGGVFFNYVPASHCGFSEYLVVDRAYRRAGIGRALVEARRATLDRQARAHGAPGARGVFIEVESPERTPAEFLERERQTALDAWDRLRVFHRLGFLRVDITYRQPPLGPDKDPVDYLDLLFCPWDETVRRQRLLPPRWIIDTVRPVWRSMSPHRHQEFLEWLEGLLGPDPIRLVPLLSSSDGEDKEWQSTRETSRETAAGNSWS